jgi:DNA polymerase-1
MSNINIHFKIDELEKNGTLSPFIAKIERRIVPIVEHMENVGIKINAKRFDKLEEFVAEELEVSRKIIFEHVGREFILNSPSVLSNILFNELNLPSDQLRKTPKGTISISSKDLYKIKDTHPIIEEIIKYRKLNKLYSTYIKILPNAADKNYRVKSMYNQIGTATGRMSSSEPNLQNIASHSDIGRRIRHAFVSEKGYSFVSCDYSQIELRLAAYLSKEETLLNAFKNNEDIHTQTSSKIFNVPPNEVTDDLRFKGKMLNFGVLYGIGPAGFAMIANCTPEEGKQYIKQYFKRLPGIYNYIQRTTNFAKQNGYTETIWGRRRYLPKIKSTDFKEFSVAQRMAVNHPVQGTAADILKKAMICVDNRILSKYKDVRLLIQIHDELLFEIKDEDINFFAPQLQEIIKNSTILNGVDLDVDVEIGKNLRDLKKINL